MCSVSVVVGAVCLYCVNGCALVVVCYSVIVCIGGWLVLFAICCLLFVVNRSWPFIVLVD